MDNRLDFFNYLTEHSKTLSEKDALLVLSHNREDGDCFASLVGDWEILSVLFSQSGYVDLKEKDKDSYKNIKKMILNTAYNICMTDEKVGSKFLKGLKEPKELIIKADKKGFVKCPFCKQKHKHEIKGGNGNRLPDCTSDIIYNPIIKNGNTYYKRGGYYVVFS